MDPVSSATSPAYTSDSCEETSASRRFPSDTPSTIVDPTSLLSTPTKEPAKILLENISFVEDLSPGSLSTREQCILNEAGENDIRWKLSPSKTIVQPKLLVRPPVPEVYTHSRPSWYKDHILSVSQKTSDMVSAHRVFLDCFVGECGFVPYYKRSREEKEKKYEKWGFVVNKIREIPGVSKHDAVFLIGRLSVARISMSNIKRWGSTLSPSNLKGCANWFRE
jgi:hypothetical protein